MPFDAAIIDPATHMAGWAPDDFWNQQMQKFVDAEVAKVQKSVDTNRRQGICPRSASEGALARKTNRFVTTTGEANDRVDAQRVNMPGRDELSAEFAERKRHNTSTTIDNSGFAKMCKECPGLFSRRLTPADLDIIFSRMTVRRGER